MSFDTSSIPSITSLSDLFGVSKTKAFLAAASLDSSEAGTVEASFFSSGLDLSSPKGNFQSKLKKLKDLDESLLLGFMLGVVAGFFVEAANFVSGANVTNKNNC